MPAVDEVDDERYEEATDREAETACHDDAVGKIDIEPTRHAEAVARWD